MDQVKIDDFKKFDIRIGTVTEAEVPKWSHWVLKMEVDLGEEIGKRVVFAGIMHFYKPENLIGKQFPFIVNLEPKKIGPEGDYSQGMMLMAVTSRKAVDGKPLVIEGEEVDEYPILFKLPKKVPNGTSVM